MSINSDMSYYSTLNDTELARLWIYASNSNEGNQYFELIAKRFSPVVYSYARSRGLREDESESIVSEVMLHLYQSVKSSKVSIEPEKFRSFLLRLTVNQVIHNIRSNKRVSEAYLKMDDALDAVSQDTLGIDTPTTTDIKLVLDSLLNHLSEKEKEIVMLVYYGGYTPSEVAEKLNMNRNHINVLLHRARTNLRKIIEKDETLNQELKFILRQE